MPCLRLPRCGVVTALCRHERHKPVGRANVFRRVASSTNASRAARQLRERLLGLLPQHALLLDAHHCTLESGLLVAVEAAALCTRRRRSLRLDRSRRRLRLDRERSHGVLIDWLARQLAFELIGDVEVKCHARTHGAEREGLVLEEAWIHAGCQACVQSEVVSALERELVRLLRPHRCFALPQLYRTLLAHVFLTPFQRPARDRVREVELVRNAARMAAALRRSP
mmetsp:Transcript_36762/g.91863  ORF Transcript_36762/g.91863 Transcript_36762/m.91863 type:complete len:225 (+) Transcript_36762:147-821(+)